MEREERRLGGDTRRHSESLGGEKRNVVSLQPRPAVRILKLWGWGVYRNRAELNRLGLDLLKMRRRPRHPWWVARRESGFSIPAQLQETSSHLIFTLARTNEVAHVIKIPGGNPSLSHHFSCQILPDKSMGFFTDERKMKPKDEQYHQTHRKPHTRSKIIPL